MAVPKERFQDDTETDSISVIVVSGESVSSGGLNGIVRSLRLVEESDADDTTPLDTENEDYLALGYFGAVELLDDVEEPEQEDLDDEEIKQLEAEAANTQDFYSVEILDHIRQGAGKAKLLSAYQEVELAKKIERGDSVAKDRMIVSNLRLVMSVAKRYRGNNVPFEDLIQEGNIGLIRAVEKFDWRRGYKFSTYATWWIRQAVQRAVYDKGGTIRLPVHVGERKQKIRKAWRELIVDFGREPTAEELAEETGIKLEHVCEAMNAVTADVSLNLIIDDSETEFGDFAAAVSDVHEDVVAKERRHKILVALSGLTDRERRVVERRFLEAGQRGRPVTFTEIGRGEDLTRERIRHIAEEALKKLQLDNGLQSLREEMTTRASDIISGEDVTYRFPGSDKTITLNYLEDRILTLTEEGNSRPIIAELLGLTEPQVKWKTATANEKLMGSKHKSGSKLNTAKSLRRRSRMIRQQPSKRT